VARESDLVVDLETPLPSTIPAGTATAVFCYGSYEHAREPVAEIDLLIDGRVQRPSAQGMARPDLDAGRRGFWAVVPIEARRAPATVALRLRAKLVGGGSETAEIGEIEVVAAPPTASDPSPDDREAPIAICMATFNPDTELLRRQLDSLRGQTHESWICLISDDCSEPERYREVERAVTGDPRFTLSRSEQRLGFYRNFERALEMVPPQADLIGLCDQDDRWHPDKLATLRAAIDDAELVYSDARLVDRGGEVLAETMWQGRRNNHEDLTSLLITNTITGAASLFRRRVLFRALPFPEAPGWQFHDHWLGAVALTSGRIAYLDRPLYDYTQHRGVVLRGLIAVPEPQPDGRRRGPRLPSRDSLRSALERWRSRYFYGYVPIRLRAQVLHARCDSSLSGGKRGALARLISAESGLRGLAWLLARGLRPLIGHSETNGTEGLLATAILWSRLVRLCARIGQGRRAGCAATMPGFDPSVLETRRWRRRHTIRSRRPLTLRRSRAEGGN
jgi:glycosyltransferase involved in cell wall biosynthesis